jgi:hypothetical protein
MDRRGVVVPAGVGPPGRSTKFSRMAGVIALRATVCSVTQTLWVICLAGSVVHVRHGSPYL